MSLTRQIHLHSPRTSDQALRERAPSGMEWLGRFAKAVRLDDRLRLLAEFGLDDRDIAKVARHASVRSIRRWRTEGAPATKASERWEPIDDLCTVIVFLLSDGSFDPESMLAWLRSRNRGLGSRRPLDALGDGDFQAVLEAAELAIGPSGVAESESVFSAHPAQEIDEEALSDAPRERRSARTSSSQAATPVSAHGPTE